MPVERGEGGEGVVDDPDVPFEDDVPDDRPHPVHTSGALMFSFGAVHPGREHLAADLFTEVSRHFGKLLADDVIEGFKPYFFADGMQGDVSGFFVVEGQRERLDALRRKPDFQRLIVRVGAAVANVRVHSLIAGTEAGRLVNLYREVRSELGL